MRRTNIYEKDTLFGGMSIASRNWIDQRDTHTQRIWASCYVCIMTLFPYFVTMDINEREFLGPETDYTSWNEHWICLMGNSGCFFLYSSFAPNVSILIETLIQRITIKMIFCVWSFVVYWEESKIFFDF